jgi:hypothetical protein
MAATLYTRASRSVHAGSRIREGVVQPKRHGMSGVERIQLSSGLAPWEGTVTTKILATAALATSPRWAPPALLICRCPRRSTRRPRRPPASSCSTRRKPPRWFRPSWSGASTGSAVATDRTPNFRRERRKRRLSSALPSPRCRARAARVCKTRHALSLIMCPLVAQKGQK